MTHKRVQCNKGHTIDRGTFQEWLSLVNPQWYQFARRLESTGSQPRTNPDGDVSLALCFSNISCIMKYFFRLLSSNSEFLTIILWYQNVPSA